jgi:hypothetical protein
MEIKVKGAKNILSSLPKAPTTGYDPRKQTEGYLRRLEGAGVDVEKATDPRGPVEKLLNLRPNQNILFDIFEVINRPQQALFTAWKAGQEGGNIGEAFLRGLSGQEQTQFKEILVNYGFEDDPDKNYELVDILGFAGDVFLDPVDWAILPVTASISGIGTIADAAKIVKSKRISDKVLEAGKTFKGLRLKNADDITKITQEGLKAKRLIDAGNTSKKAQNALSRFEKLQELVKISVEGEKVLGRASALGMSARGAKRGIVKLAGLTDEVATKGLMAVDRLNGITFKDETVRSFRELILDTGKEKKSWTLGYYTLKDSLGGMFDIASKIPENILTAIRKQSGGESLTRKALANSNEKVKKTILKAAEAGTGGTSIEQVGRNLLNFFEYFNRKTPGKVRKLSLEEIITSGSPMSQKVFNSISKTLKKFGVDLSDDAISASITVAGKGGTKRYTLSKDLSEKIADEILSTNPNLANKLFSRSNFYTKEARQALEALGKDEAFMKVFNEVSPEIEKMQKALAVFQESGKLQNFTEAGYARHVYNTNLEAFEQLAKQSGDEVLKEVGKIAEGIRYGNTKAVASRKWQMSTLEANTIFKEQMLAKLNDPLVELSDEARKILTDVSQQNLFVETLQASMDDWITEIPKLVKDANIIDEVLVKSIVTRSADGALTIGPSDIIHINYAGAKETLPRGFVKIDMGEFRKKLKELIKVNDSPEMAKLFQELGEKGALQNAGVAIDKHVYSMISKYMVQPGDMGIMLRIVDAANNQFKKLKLLSAGFHVRNIVGNFTNAMLVGMPAEKIPLYFKKADDVIRRGQKLVDTVLASGGDLSKLTAKDRSAYQLYKRFIEEGFGNISSDLYDLSADVIGKKADIFTAKGLKEKTDSILQLNNSANEFFDMRYRMGLYMYAGENANIARNIGLQSPGDVVRRALFDPKATSRAERETIKRIVPFYTFAKKNLAYQMRNIFDNPSAYNRVQKGVRGLWNLEGISVDDIENYKKENFWVPVPGMTKDGKYTAIKTNLPLGDIAEWLESPLVKGISSLTPMVRAPFEVATGVQTFTGRPIQDFEGQKGYLFPNIPRNLEYLVGQTGLDVPFAALRNVVRTSARLAGLDQEEDATLGTSVPSAFSEGDLERAQRARDYDELSRIRDLFSYYKQELGEIPTVAEIENKNQNQIQVKSRLDGLLKTK